MIFTLTDWRNFKVDTPAPPVVDRSTHLCKKHEVTWYGLADECWLCTEEKNMDRELADAMERLANAQRALVDAQLAVFDAKDRLKRAQGGDNEEPD